MKINWDAVIKDPFGKPVLNEDNQPTTLGGIAARVAIVMLRGDETLSEQDSKSIYRFADAGARGGISEIKTEEAALLKKRVNQMYSPWLREYVDKLIEGGVVEEKKEGDAGALADSDLKLKAV